MTARWICSPALWVFAASTLSCTATISGEPEGKAAPSAEEPELTPPAAEEPTVPSAPCADVIPRRIWQLTPNELAATVESAIPGGGDELRELEQSWADSQGFSNDPSLLQLSVPQVTELARLGERIADRIATAPPAEWSCLAARPAPEGCVDGFIASLGARAYRRPLLAEEVKTHRTLYESEALARGFDSALRQVIRAFLLSPRFLFRSELGLPTSEARKYRLSSAEVASAISYSLLDGPPDAELALAASREELTTKAQITAHVARLVEAPGATGVQKFLSEHLLVDKVASIDKSAEAAPTFNRELARDMQRELESFLELVLWRKGGSVGALLGDRTARVTPALSALYGVEGGVSGEVELPAEQRAGLLTRAGVLASLAHSDKPSAVSRGKFIRTKLLCGVIPPPPSDVEMATPSTEALSERERSATRLAQPACRGCHELMDPLGLTLEAYDLLGAWQSDPSGARIDTSGAIALPGHDTALPVRDALELSETLAALPEVESCLAAEATRYVTGIAPERFTSCAEGQSVVEGTRAARGNIKAMFAAALTEQLTLPRIAEEE